MRKLAEGCREFQLESPPLRVTMASNKRAAARGRDAMNIQEKSRYHEVHARSLRDPEGFWAEAAREINWIEPAKKVFDPAMGVYGRWFAGAVVNSCYNALDRHVARGRADQLALI